MDIQLPSICVPVGYSNTIKRVVFRAEPQLVSVRISDTTPWWREHYLQIRISNGTLFPNSMIKIPLSIWLAASVFFLLFVDVVANGEPSSTL